MTSKCEKTVVCENGRTMRLVYSITSGIYAADEGATRTYGIRVEKYFGNTLEESEEIANITAKTIEINRLFMVCCINRITA